jgi:NAD(P)-dependent dehydrogenase (short-subunit alcohol dehydrogenase family)
MDPDAPAEVVARAAEAFGGVDILVNNAGGPPPGDHLPHEGFLARDDAQWQAVLEFNLLSAVRACRAALPLLQEHAGAIVNVASAVARQPSPMNVDYAAAKAAMLSLTKALSEEFGPQGVRVNAVSPGPVLTPWWTDEGGAGDIVAGWAGSDRDSVIATLAPEQMQLTTGRFVAPREIADAVAFLASPRSAATTGAEFVVDSGMLKAL